MQSSMKCLLAGISGKWIAVKWYIPEFVFFQSRRTNTSGFLTVKVVNTGCRIPSHILINMFYFPYQALINRKNTLLIKESTVVFLEKKCYYIL